MTGSRIIVFLMLLRRSVDFTEVAESENVHSNLEQEFHRFFALEGLCG